MIVGDHMSIAWALRRAFCAFSVVAASVVDPGGTPAYALDAPAAPALAAPTATAKSKIVAAPTSNKPAKTAPGKTQSQAPAKPQAQPAATAPKPVQAHPAGWPTNATSDMQRDHRYSPPPPAPEPQKPKTSPAQNTADTASDAPPEAEEQYFFQRMIRARTRIMGSEPAGGAKREERVEAPDNSRHPALDSAKPKEDATKSSGFFNTISALWGGGDPPAQPAASESAAATPTPPPAGSETSRLLSKISGMMPGFLGGSDKK